MVCLVWRVLGDCDWCTYIYIYIYIIIIIIYLAGCTMFPHLPAPICFIRNLLHVCIYILLLLFI